MNSKFIVRGQQYRRNWEIVEWAIPETLREIITIAGTAQKSSWPYNGGFAFTSKIIAIFNVDCVEETQFIDIFYDTMGVSKPFWGLVDVIILAAI